MAVPPPGPCAGRPPHSTAETASFLCRRCRSRHRAALHCWCHFQQRPLLQLQSLPWGHSFPAPTGVASVVLLPPLRPYFQAISWFGLIPLPCVFRRSKYWYSRSIGGHRNNEGSRCRERTLSTQTDDDEDRGRTTRPPSHTRGTQSNALPSVYLLR